MENKFITYAHRGASEYCPENTFMSFYTGLYMGANGIETDVQMTKDGVPVLFHDGTLDRVMGQNGNLSDYYYVQFREFPITKNEKTDYIPTLDEFFNFFSKQELTFAIELKGEGAEKITSELIEKFGISEKCVITSFNFDYLLNMKRINPKLKLGFLAGQGKICSDLLRKMQENSFNEICTNANDITRENIVFWHSLGFNVRAWGGSMRCLCIMFMIMVQMEQQ